MDEEVFLAARVPFCSLVLVLLSFRRTSWEDCKELSNSCSPGSYPKSLQQFSKPHAEIPLLLKKSFVFPNSATYQNVSALKAFKLTADIADRFCSSSVLSRYNEGGETRMLSLLLKYDRCSKELLGRGVIVWRMG